MKMLWMKTQEKTIINRILQSERFDVIKLFGCILLLTGSLTTFAQVEIVPTQRAFPGNSWLPGARIAIDGPLALPFWDDFSTPSGDYPDSMLWENSRSVWVNNTMAINQPTINVATFDGLDSLGLPYDATNILEIGYTDKLISKPIDLSDPVIDHSNTYLSFFYEWQGKGEAPDPSDYLELQFKDNTSTWRSVMSIYPKNSFDRSTFYDTAIRVANEYFFHDDFQFRFRSFGRQSGPYDAWHLDYIYLNDDRDPNDHSYPERAAASEVTSPLGTYSAIPYWHFVPENYADTIVTFDVKNLSDLLDPITNDPYPIAINYMMRGKFTNYLSNGSTSVVEDIVVPSTGVNGVNGIMEPFERIAVESKNLFDDAEAQGYFRDDADSVDVTLKAVVISDDENDRDKAKLAPLDLTVNDTVSTTFRLRNYYAYDDGVAEYSAGLIQAGSRLAYQFQELYDNVNTVKNDPDTLIGFDVYFPPYAVTNNQTISFFVFDDSRRQEGRPDTILVQISRPIKRSGLNEFQKIRFSPALLVADTFYIGWQQPLAGTALVGLDIDNDTGYKIYYTTDIGSPEKASWTANESVHGSLMIRPVFGSGSIDETVAVAEELKFGIYPNPTYGSFFIDERFDHLSIFSATGVAIPFDMEKQMEKTKVTLDAAPGLYIIQLSRNHQLVTQKILLRR